jgi:hypothetical protein
MHRTLRNVFWAIARYLQRIVCNRNLDGTPIYVRQLDVDDEAILAFENIDGRLPCHRAELVKIRLALQVLLKSCDLDRKLRKMLKHSHHLNLLYCIDSITATSTHLQSVKVRGWPLVGVPPARLPESFFSGSPKTLEM